MIIIEDKIHLYYNSIYTKHKWHLRTNEINKLQGDYDDEMTWKTEKHLLPTILLSMHKLALILRWTNHKSTNNL